MLVSLTAHPHQNNSQTKATANTCTPSSMGTKSRKTMGGALHKGAPRPRPSLLYCAEEWRGPGAAAVGCTGHLRRPLSLETKSGAVSVQAAGDEEGGGVYKTKGTLCQINVELTPHSSCRSAAGVGGGLQVREEAFKVDVSHISHGTKESQRCAIWTQPHHLFRNHSKKSSRSQ